MVKSTQERINEKLKNKVKVKNNGSSKKIIFNSKYDLTFLIFDIPDGIEIIKSGETLKIYDYINKETYSVEFQK